jgi:hypothetical protein
MEAIMNKSFFKFKVLVTCFLFSTLGVFVFIMQYYEVQIPDWLVFIIYGLMIFGVVIGEGLIKCEQCGRNQFDYEIVRAMKKTKTNEWLPNECVCGIHRYDFFEGLDAILHKDKHTLEHEDLSIWGKPIEQIKQFLEMDGAIVTPKKPYASSSGIAQVLNVTNSTLGIKEIQYSPSSPESTHKVAYYKVTYIDGKKVKIIDPVLYRPFYKNKLPIYDRNTTFLNPEGQRITFNAVTNKWVSTKL